MESLPFVGDGWASNPSSFNKGPGAEGDDRDTSGEEDIPEDSAEASPVPGVSLNLVANDDKNIDPELQLLSVLFFKLTISTTPPVSSLASISPLASSYSPTTTSFLLQSSKAPANADSPSAANVLHTLSSHAYQSTTSASTSKEKDKARVTAGAASSSLSIPPHAPSSSGSSSACKQPRDVGSEVSTKLTETSDSLVCQIQNSAEANSHMKRMKIQAQIIRKELKACNKNAQCEHDLKMKMMENKHLLSMASEQMKQLELEVKLEQIKIA
ncbi:hypothetical protein PISMIDRAFT_14705 [Pisolithus microcarpus 441]|uniref:Uncharacterized protein n=1 Tax=Pisolithus microcarpus 441 TaxID=765257 RepID=A0A0C9YVG8_9AGAM|nr:hypothetical protein PISMIDRAFT_14705 [Pisolithus microcarpus 441]